MEAFVTRFAPSPTGRLHMGHALSAFAVWEAARRAGGQVLLRIEDIDLTRCRPEFREGIFEDLAWLGLQWQGPVRCQSDHFDDYRGVLSHLQARGLIYRCVLTRKERTEATVPAASGDVPEGKAFAWRLSLERARRLLGDEWGALHYLEEAASGVREIAADPSRFGDIVLARKDTPASYHLACCHDDWLQGITHVIRGEDLRDVTAIHVLLQKLLGWPQPVYSFHRLVLGIDGSKLSKSRRDKSLAQYRAEGMTPDDIRAMTKTT